MTGRKEKTISGAMYSAPNLEHNLRTHIPPNSVEERRHLNWVYTKDSEITLPQVYEKLFAKPYKEWRDREIKKGRGKRFPPTYYRRLSRINRSIFARDYLADRGYAGYRFHIYAWMMRIVRRICWMNLQSICWNCRRYVR